LYLRAPLSNDIIRVSSEFPGGTKGLVRYLERSLNRELPMRNGAPVGRYPVLVNFMVDTEGNIFNLKAENDPGYGTAQEALRVFKQGPKWVPASENGTNVVDQHRQTIVFMVL
jgi:protein TonB